MVEGGLSKADAADQFNTTPKTVAKWVERFRAEGVDGLRDRSSRPLSSPSQTPPATCAAVEALRRQRHTGKQIAAEVGVSPATVSRILRRLGLTGYATGAGRAGAPLRARASRRADPHRHQEARPLRSRRPPHHRRSPDRANAAAPAGSSSTSAIDDALPPRLLPDPARREEGERRRLPQGGRRLLRQPRRHRHPRHDRQRLLLSIQGLRQRPAGSSASSTSAPGPTRRKTNGKAERFIQTALREWAYAHAYDTSDHRADELPIWLHQYNWHRPHGSLKSKPPISRLGLPRTTC